MGDRGLPPPLNSWKCSCPCSVGFPGRGLGPSDTRAAISRAVISSSVLVFLSMNPEPLGKRIKSEMFFLAGLWRIKRKASLGLGLGLG